jgi:hypothetical protein
LRLLGQRSDCPICGRPLLDLDEGERLVGGARARDWFPAHCQTTHPDYLVWKRSKAFLSNVLGIISAALVLALIIFVLYILGIHPPTNRSGGAILVFPTLFAYVIPRILINHWGIRKFRREWQARGGLPAPSFILGGLCRQQPPAPLGKTQLRHSRVQRCASR